VALNFSSSSQPFDIGQATHGVSRAKSSVLLTTSSTDVTVKGDKHTILLSPYAVFIARITP
jgi:hypothetical protein